MSSRSLNKRTSPNPLRDYGRAIHALAQENAAAVEEMLPDGVDDLHLLASLCDDLHIRNNAWLDLVSDRRVARAQSETAAGTASGQYDRTLVHMQLVARKIEDRAAVEALFEECPARSTLKSDELPDAMGRLRARIDARPGWFPRLSANADRLAKFDAAREGLVEALAAYSGVSRACTLASAQRSQTRAALFDQIRVVEIALKKALTADEYAQVATLRSHHLPLIAKADEEEKKDDEPGGESPEDG